MFPAVIEQALEEIRAVREMEWRKRFCREHKLYRYDSFFCEEDIRQAPYPTDKDLGFPLQTLTVQWDTGFATIELSALAKLPAAQRNKIYKLGGL